MKERVSIGRIVEGGRPLLPGRTYHKRNLFCYNKMFVAVHPRSIEQRGLSTEVQAKVYGVYRVKLDAETRGCSDVYPSLREPPSSLLKPHALCLLSLPLTP